MRKFLEMVLAGESLNREQAIAVIDQLIDGEVPNEQVSAFLVALRMKNETATELGGFIEALSRRALMISKDYAPEFPGLIDVCGTGGDALGTFNVSTGVALVLASAGVKVAKHGNRGVSSVSGSSDVLEILGLKSDLTPDSALHSLRTHGVSFLFAPAFHPMLAKLSIVRKKLGVYTFLNALGPLLNPAPLHCQMMGVYHPSLLLKAATVLKERRMKDAMMVHGLDGLDELTLTGPTSYALLSNGEITQGTCSPEDFGLSRAGIESVKGGSPQENAQILIHIFEGEKSPRRDLVLMNAAAALVLSKKSKNYREAMSLAAEVVDSGKTIQLLKQMQFSSGGSS